MWDVLLDKTTSPLYCIPCHSHINTHNTQLYVHRSGRTARAQLEGLSVLLVGPEDVHAYNSIRRILNRGKQPTLVASLSLSHHIDGSCFHDVLTPHPLHTHHIQDNDLPTFPVDSSYLAPLRDRVRLARQVVSMEQKGRRMCRGNKWALQVAKAMEIEVEEDMYPT